DQEFEVNADILHNALSINLKVLDHPFTLPAPKKEIIKASAEYSEYSKKKKRKDHDVSPSKKTKDRPTSSKGTTIYKSSKTNKTMQAEETIEDHDQEAGMDEERTVNEVVNVDDHPQDDSSSCQDKSKWFNQSPRPETPYPEWHKEPNENDAHENPWFNEMNLKGDRIPQDLSKPIPMLGAPGRLYILVDLFFNKDLEY
nr:hypothetical protein [Tanacetum cinerariifolium]